MRSETKTLYVYSFVHFIVDLLSCYYLYTYCNHPLLWIIGYHGVAFALQPIIGILTDRYRHIPYGIIAILCIGIGYVCHSFSFVGVLIVGLGNALFHLEGGYVCLHQKPHKISFGGIFVSFGTFGISLGTIFGLSQFSYANQIIYLLGMIAFVLMWMNPVSIELKNRHRTFSLLNQKSSAIGFVLISIIIRSYTGFVLPYPDMNMILRILLVGICAWFGKFIGGILVDHYSVRIIWISQFLGIFTLLCTWLPISFIILIFINLPMAFTLACLNDCYPENTGFAFGLAPFGLFIGYILSIYIPLQNITACIMIAVLLCIDGCIIYRISKKTG